MSGVSERYNLLDPDEADKGITAAMAAMRAGELIVIPTDTVYGVAAEAFDQRAVARLLRAKDRGRDVPTPVLIGSAYAMEGLADDVDENRAQAHRRVLAGWIVARVQAAAEPQLGPR